MNSLLPLGYQIDKLARTLARRFTAGFILDEQQQLAVGTERTPLLRNGDEVLNLNFTAIDKFAADTGGSATIFVQRDKDFVRIATSVKKENGERAIGTLLDHSHAGYDALLSGRSYVGFAQLFGRQYMTRYDPIRNSAGRVVGVLYVGIDVSKRFQFGVGGRIAGIGLLMSGAVLGSYIWVSSAVMETAIASLGRTASPATMSALMAASSLQLHYGFVALALLVLVMVALFWGVRKMITTPLTAATAAAQQLAKGDLTTLLHVGRRDELGQLMQAVNGVAQGLAGIVGTVRGTSERINTAARDIAAGNNDLSARAEAQAGELEQVRASMERFGGSIRTNAEHTNQAGTLVDNAAVQAGEGGQVVNSVVATMGAIRASSHKVADIISVIDGIAFQTNILALNAAVEAARAGEQGRGFAVVASEVRQLAQRSATAAREIKDVIVTSVDQVAAGAALVDRTGTTMRDIVDGIDRVAQAMDHIVDASARQRDEIAAVEGNLAEMRRGAGRNASAIATTQDSVQALHATADSLTASLRNVQV